MADIERNYWNTAVDLDDFSLRHETWRAYCDELGAAWIDAWLEGTAAKRILKTDLFDEAVGSGFLPLLRAHSSQLVGIDVAQETVCRAQRRQADLLALRCDVRTLPFASATFDTIVAPSTLDHFHDARDIARSIAELSRVLRPGGRLIVSFDNLANPLVWLRNILPFALLHRIGLVPYFVGATLDRAQLVAALHAAGFEVTETRAIMHCPRAPAVAILSLLDKLGASRMAKGVKKACLLCERLEHLRSAYRTGNYVASLEIKGPDA